MNANGFIPSPSLQSSASNERFKPLFQSPSSVTEVKKDLLSYKNDLSVNVNAGEYSGRQIFSKSIEFSLGLKLEPTYEFKLPSPKDVAKTVLGFVENRINSEKQAGASIEKLNDLMSQARSGIEKGYAQAEKDIKGLDLMTEELAEDISKGLGLINQGLDNIEADLDKAVQPSVASAIGEKTNNNSLTPLGLNESEAESIFGNASLASLEKNAAEAATSKFVSYDQLNANKADFVLNTQEGDQILIRLADMQALSYTKSEQGESLGISKSSSYEFSVKGDLNEDELKAINNILEQVENISSLFFSDKFEEAFSSALDLGFDSEQIASFSLDLSKLQVQEVRSYQDSSKTALDSYKRNQPLVNVAQQFEKFEALLEPLARFEKVSSMIESLVSKALEAYAVEKPEASPEVNESLSNYQLFSGKLLDAILLSDEK